MKVVVLGGTGFVGHHVAAAFLRAGHAVAVAARPGRDRSLLAGLDVEVLDADLREPATLEAAFAGRELVVHAAGLLSLWQKDAQALYDVNVLGTRHVVQACLSAGVRRLIYTGSVGVYAGSRTPEPVDERGAADVSRFHSFHVTSMCLAESEVLKGIARGLDAVLLHPSLCVGEGDRGFHSSWVMLGLAFARVPVVPPGGLNVVDVLDVARAHVLAADRGPAGGSYLIGGENLSNRAYADLLAEVLGLSSLRAPVSRLGIRALGRAAEWSAALRGIDRGDYVTLNRALSDAMSLYWFIDDRRARQDLGHQPSEVRPALERQVAWLKERGSLSPTAGLGLRAFWRQFFSRHAEPSAQRA